MLIQRMITESKIIIVNSFVASEHSRQLGDKCLLLAPTKPLITIMWVCIPFRGMEQMIAFERSSALLLWKVNATRITLS